MSDPQPTRRVQPAILARARELRQEMTPQERRLWRHLRRKQLHGLKFRRQHPVGRFVLDFYCHRNQLVVELDGGVHYHQKEYDDARTEWLIQHGFTVIRFTNDQVLNDIETVLSQIAAACDMDE